MTGYGKSLKEYNGQSILVEMRSLNNRYCDLNIKLPNSYRSKDMEIRSLLTQELVRGKIDLTLTVTGSEDSTAINEELFKSYYKQLSDLANDVGADTANLMASVLQLPEVITSGSDELDEGEWLTALGAIRDSIGQIQGFRQHEGQAMRNDLNARLDVIAAGLEDVRKLDPQRYDQIRKRIGGSLAKWLKEEDHDPNRFEQELLYYLEKMDINEEMVRLRAHLDHFREELGSQGNEKGKILGFIAQEMGREVNTISSKANDAAMQKVVVGMKDELEKIKEMLLNVL